MTKAKDMYGLIPTSVLTAPPPNFDGSERRMDANKSSRETPSSFPDWLAEFLLKYYNRSAGRVLDPFHGWGDRSSMYKQLGMPYVGVDVVPRPGVVQANSINLPFPDNSFDFLITSPPYWNIERYDSVPGQLTDIGEYYDFMQQLSLIVRECSRVLKPGALGCWMVGDFRAKGRFYDFSGDLVFEHKVWCSRLFDKVIVDKSRRYRLPLFIPQADRLGYTVKVHEYVLVFRYE